MILREPSDFEQRTRERRNLPDIGPVHSDEYVRAMASGRRRHGVGQIAPFEYDRLFMRGEVLIVGQRALQKPCPDPSDSRRMRPKSRAGLAPFASGVPSCYDSRARMYQLAPSFREKTA